MQGALEEQLEEVLLALTPGRRREDWDPPAVRTALAALQNL